MTNQNNLNFMNDAALDETHDLQTPSHNDATYLVNERDTQDSGTTSSQCRVLLPDSYDDFTPHSLASELTAASQSDILTPVVSRYASKSFRTYTESPEWKRRKLLKATTESNLGSIAELDDWPISCSETITDSFETVSIPFPTDSTPLTADATSSESVPIPCGAFTKFSSPIISNPIPTISKSFSTVKFSLSIIRNPQEAISDPSDETVKEQPQPLIETPSRDFVRKSSNENNSQLSSPVILNHLNHTDLSHQIDSTNVKSTAMETREQSKVLPHNRSIKQTKSDEINARTMWLTNARQRFMSSIDSEISLTKLMLYKFREMDWSHTLKLVFSEESLGQIVAGFLKPSEIRVLIYVLGLENEMATGYYELLCRQLVTVDWLADIMRDSSIRLDTQQCQKEEFNSLPISPKADSVEIMTEEEEEEALSFKNLKQGTTYEHIYKSQLLGHFCDDCLKKIHPDNDGISKMAVTLPLSCQIKHEYNSNSLDAADSKALLKVTFCCDCASKFVNRDDVIELLEKIEEGRDILVQTKFLHPNLARPQFDHGGACISDWPRTLQQFNKARQKFISALRENFARRISKRFGQSFYKIYIHKILPPTDFLARDALSRKYLYIPKSRAVTSTKRSSKYANAPQIDRYPLGSIERSAALSIRELFAVWSSETQSVHRLVAAEVEMVKKFKMVHDVATHKNYMTAASLIEDYVLTRQINRNRFDLNFLPLIWRVLHRGTTGKRRTFIASFEDRQRIDKFFSPCCEGARPCLKVKGYLGIPISDHETETVDTYEQTVEEITKEEAAVVPEEPVPMSALERLELAIQRKCAANKVC